MDFLKKYLIRLLIVAVVGTAVWLLFPDWARSTYQSLTNIFGPFAIVIILALALPRIKFFKKQE